LTLPNIEFQEIYYRWNLIEADADDNKFVDCAIAAAVDYLVSEDRHFVSLGAISFPKVYVIKLGEFVEMIQGAALDN
jgi:predicted nucleic acid-binding protein